MAGKPKVRPATLVANVRTVLENCGLSDHKVGKALNVAHTTVMRWRTGATLPSDLEAFVAWCGIPERDLREASADTIKTTLIAQIRAGKCSEMPVAA